MKFSLQTDGDTALASVSSAWDFNNPPASAVDIESEISRLMAEGRGIGFAANQMGFHYRVMAMDIGNNVVFFYNPEITQSTGEEIAMEEGCLSFPGLFFKVKRSTNIAVRYQDRDGEFHEGTYTGLTARCFQHELDHLNGVCFTDRVSKLTLDMARKKRAKNERKK